MGRAGFRLDRRLGQGGSLTWQGDIYRGERGQVYRFPTLTPPYTRLVEDDDGRLSGGNLLARWRHTFTRGSELRLQAYYDRAEWDDALIAEVRDTYDLDFQHRFSWGDRQEMVWGLGYRFTTDDIGNTPIFSLHPESRGSPLYSAFLQDRIALSDRVRLFLGSKFEHNDYTGFEYQPSARLLCTPSPRHAAWAAFTRIVSTSRNAIKAHKSVGYSVAVGAILVIARLRSSHFFRANTRFAPTVNCRRRRFPGHNGQRFQVFVIY